MIQNNVGCRIEETLHIRKIDEEFFEQSRKHWDWRKRIRSLKRAS
jgi:hypothetical protein